ncbi:MAG: hypothetical protein AAF399_28325 [Bacteroidota bacterium]
MSQTDPKLILESIQNDMAMVGQDLKTIAHQVIEEGISEYPVFIASQQLLNLGKPVFDPETAGLNWFFQATILEDLVQREIVSKSRVNEFRKALGDPKATACVMVVLEQGVQVVFVPFDIE